MRSWKVDLLDVPKMREIQRQEALEDVKARHANKYILCAGTSVVEKDRRFSFVDG